MVGKLLLKPWRIPVLFATKTKAPTSRRLLITLKSWSVSSIRTKTFGGEHFVLDDSGVISAKTDIGAAAVKILRLNHPDSIIERRALIEKGWRF